MFHIINHLTFKAALFMSAGIVDHETHTRDIKRLGGLRHLMPITFAIATLAALSMAGIPLLNGFLSQGDDARGASGKDPLRRAEYAGAGAHGDRRARCSRRPIPSASSSTPSSGPVRDDYPAKPHDPPSFGMWLPRPQLLVMCWSS